MDIAIGLTSGSSTPVYLKGGIYNVQVTGTFGGATIAFEHGDHEDNWFSSSETQFTAHGAVNVTLPGSGKYPVRATVTGGSGVNVTVRAIG
ncbi:MAG: hypothetical protein KME67_10850 [Candidatus Thiodiazotropha sp. (ex Codakia orbicularis)]|nr:hypothetical protein [Candidatus Thiodiazotropha sp. (ex Codakia orbicularis)]MCG7863859.1 hypothetical protein [Candidatus Thiodiazotropha endolucinida]